MDIKVEKERIYKNVVKLVNSSFNKNLTIEEILANASHRAFVMFHIDLTIMGLQSDNSELNSQKANILHSVKNEIKEKYI